LNRRERWQKDGGQKNKPRIQKLNRREQRERRTERFSSTNGHKLTQIKIKKLNRRERRERRGRGTEEHRTSNIECWKGTKVQAGLANRAGGADQAGPADHRWTRMGLVKWVKSGSHGRDHSTGFRVLPARGYIAAAADCVELRLTAPRCKFWRGKGLTGFVLWPERAVPYRPAEDCNAQRNESLHFDRTASLYNCKYSA
jgi:hypothetical protein